MAEAPFDLSLGGVIAHNVLGYVGKQPDPTLEWQPQYRHPRSISFTATPAVYKVTVVEDQLNCHTEQDVAAAQEKGFTVREPQLPYFLCIMKKVKEDTWPRNMATEGMLRAMIDGWFADIWGGSMKLTCGPVKDEVMLGHLEYEFEVDNGRESEQDYLREGRKLPANFKRLQELHAAGRAQALCKAEALVRVFLSAPDRY